MGKTKIEWATHTWNPAVGCSKISAGCLNCYAEKMAQRQAAMSRAKRAKGQKPGRSRYYERVTDWQGAVPVREALYDPYEWRKPRRVFVCSMSDLFHSSLPFEYIREVFEVMSAPVNRQHTFYVLTKRPERMVEFYRGCGYGFPIAENMYIGVTVENMKQAAMRIPQLGRIRAAVRFISCEPLLESLSTTADQRGIFDVDGPVAAGMAKINPRDSRYPLNIIDWVISGAETGPRARPLDMQWVRDLRDDCVRLQIPFFHKKNGPRGGRLIDGVEWRQMPTPG